MGIPSRRNQLAGTSWLTRLLLGAFANGIAVRSPASHSYTGCGILCG